MVPHTGQNRSKFSARQSALAAWAEQPADACSADNRSILPEKRDLVRDVPGNCPVGLGNQFDTIDDVIAG